jgi:acetylornithine deacetylase
MGVMNEKLKSVLQQNSQTYIDNLLALVALDTRDLGHGIGGGLEANGQKYLKEIYRSLGAEISIEPMSEEPIVVAFEGYHEGNKGHNYENRYNVYARLKGERDISLMFNGHVDTLPPNDESSWTFAPLSPFVRDGKIYGMGVCDMKAGLMAAAMAVRLLRDCGIRLPCNVILSSVCDEEGGGNGSIVAAMGGLKADAVVVCEPTSNDLILAHMGFVFFEIDVTGRAVHCGLKAEGVNAIEKAFKIIRAIDELELEWLLTYKHPLLPPPSSNVGVIKGGEAGSTVAERCLFKTCVHYHPGTMSYNSVTAQYIDAINTCCDGDKWLREHRPIVSVYQSGGPFEMNADHPLVETFCGAFNLVYEKNVKIVGSPAGCDSRIWHAVAKSPTIQYGPGRLAQSHVADEYVDVADYLKTIEVYAQLILEWGKRGIRNDH